MSTTAAGRPPRRWTRRRWALASVGAALAVLAVVLVLVLTGEEDGARQAEAGAATPSSAGPAPSDPPSASPTPTPSGTATSGPAATPAEPAGAGPATGIPAMLAPVALDEAAVVADGVTVTLPAVESVDAVGTGPGNVSGPALAVTVRVTNGTAEPISLDGLQVTVAHSAEETAASPVNDPAASPAQGPLAPGASAEGRYVFSVPVDGRYLVTVVVGYAAAAPLLVFQGPVG